MQRHSVFHIQRALGAGALVLFAAAAAGPLDAQRTSPANRPAWKGVWEPVSYSEDVFLNDVFFVNPDVGWVTSGNPYQGGMLLRTRDGGATWTVELGDHESKEPPFFSPYFLDEKLGWVLQPAGIGKYKVLRTDDGDSWQQVGSINASWGLLDYVFLSKHVGLHLDANDNVGRIARTTDGGRTWKDVFRCRAKITVNGLARDVDCNLKGMHFPSASVGYAIGGAHGAARTLFVAKTEDGGATWKLNVVTDIGGDLEVYHDHEVFFVDENTGYAHLSENRLYRTTDGGRTWTGLVGTPGNEIKFADPEVGWSFNGARLSYTTNGGARWSSRELSFPAEVHAFSLPRRDRAYVVGNHGMIYRYSVIPGAEPTPPTAMEAPAMPTFESELDDRVETVDTQFETLEDQIEQAAQAAADTVVVVDACCLQSMNKLQTTVDALTPLVPQFLGKYRNVNLIIAGLQFLGVLPDRLAQVKAALKNLRAARGPTATAAALTELSGSIDALALTTRQAFQKAPMEYAGADAAYAPSSSAAISADPSSDAAAAAEPEASASDSSEASEGEGGAKKKVTDEAKKKATDAVKKRIKVRFP